MREFWRKSGSLRPRSFSGTLRNINNYTVATMGGRKLKYDQRKYYEMKLKVSIPLHKLDVVPFHLSLPSSAYTSTPVSNGQHLGERCRATCTMLLPRDWSVTGGADTAHTTIYKVLCSASGVASTRSVVIHTDLTSGHSPWIPPPSDHQLLLAL